VRMLHAGGMQVTVIGFRRRSEPIHDIDGAPTIDLGITRDGRLVHRAWAIIRTMFRFGPVAKAVHAADVIMARNLEMLLLGIRARAGRRLVYECLDIHRLLLGQGLASRLITMIEGWALARAALIITSSNRFAEDYFRQRRGFAGPVLLVENKVLALDGPHRLSMDDRAGPGGPPWVIGWFGMLRCRRSLAELSQLAASGGGAIKVLIAGIASEQEFVDFDGAVAAAPGLEFVGRYTAADLPALYGRVDFAWAIDYFEEGLNSAWLLPNRLYEAMAHGAVPVALDSVETGNWLRRNGVGITVENAAAALPMLLAGMTAEVLQQHRDRIAALPERLLLTTAQDCTELVEAILLQS
jgi:succinoglycan biosynthesis protein ExoL